MMVKKVMVDLDATYNVFEKRLDSTKTLGLLVLESR